MLSISVIPDEAKLSPRGENTVSGVGPSFPLPVACSSFDFSGISLLPCKTKACLLPSRNICSRIPVAGFLQLWLQRPSTCPSPAMMEPLGTWKRPGQMDLRGTRQDPAQLYSRVFSMSSPPRGTIKVNSSLLNIYFW